MKRTVLLGIMVLFASSLIVAPGVQAGPGSGPTAVVSLGDSFISGEGGRWNGNALSPFRTRFGTDRAAVNCDTWSCDYEPHLVYGASYDNDCHRSDVATIQSSGIAVQNRINLACSGARTNNIWRASQGGSAYKGEAPQADQLATVAAQNDVKLVVLTISANDLGFSDHVIDCTVAWTFDEGPCWPEEQAEMEAALPAAAAGLRKAIDEVRAVMSGAGYSPSQWRFVLAGYSSPIPAAANMRYPESGWSRLDTGGCPFYDEDADWAKNVATPIIVDNMRSIAAEKGVQFLDVRDALNGHEVCHVQSSLVGSSGPNPIDHEWVRWLNSGCCQGDAQESLHPNAYGQQAIGRCLGLVYGQPSGNFTCLNQPGAGYNSTYISGIP